MGSAVYVAHGWAGDAIIESGNGDKPRVYLESRAAVIFVYEQLGRVLNVSSRSEEVARLEEQIESLRRSNAALRGALKRKARR